MLSLRGRCLQHAFYAPGHADGVGARARRRSATGSGTGAIFGAIAEQLLLGVPSKNKQMVHAGWRQ